MQRNDKKEIRIWVNHWFSTMYRLIEDARRHLNGLVNYHYNDSLASPSIISYSFKFIGTNKLSACVYQKVCDEFYIEPSDISGDDYVDWCLNFCEEHNIDIFAPRREQMSIARRAEEFKSKNILLLCDTDADKLDICDDKFKTYMHMHDVLAQPHCMVANNYDEFIKALDTLSAVYPHDRICFKYSRGEGATSFRVIDDNMEDISSLTSGMGMKMSRAMAEAMFKSVDHFDDLLLMPYMKGPEISIDCIPTSRGLVVIPRMKKGRVTQIIPHKKYIELARQFNDTMGLERPFNIQFRWFNGELMFMEVNTRLSGGSHIVGMGSGDCNIRLLTLDDNTLPLGDTSKVVNKLAEQYAYGIHPISVLGVAIEQLLFGDISYTTFACCSTFIIGNDNLEVEFTQIETPIKLK